MHKGPGFESSCHHSKLCNFVFSILFPFNSCINDDLTLNTDGNNYSHYCFYLFFLAEVSLARVISLK